MTESAEHRVEKASLRRAPRYGTFLALGAAVGIVAAFALTFAFGPDADTSAATGLTYSTTQVLGFLCLGTIPAGIALGGLVALVLDRRMARRARDVQIDRERITGAE